MKILQYIKTGYRLILYSLILLLATVFNAASQTRIEDAIKNNSKHKFKSIDELAGFINNNADSDREKAYGAYYWIANNVVYDVKKFLKGKPSYSVPDKVFEKKKAVCEGYASLFRELCRKMNLKCEVIAGYSKGYGYQPGKPFTEADHAWNAVKIDSTWHLIDVTWAAGSIKRNLFGAKFIKEFNNDFFFLPPKEFVVTHLPEVPMWQLLDNPVPIKTFSSSNDKIYSHFKNAPSMRYNFKDTIRNFYSLSDPERPVKYGEMALKFNPQNIVPLALSIVVPLKYKLENTYFQFYDKTIHETDSLINMTENAVELLKKSKSSKQSVKELVEINLINGYEVLSELLFIKAELMRKKIKNIKPTDSLNAYKPIVEVLERSLLANRETNNIKQFEKVDSHLCSVYKTFFELYTVFLNNERDELQRKQIQKELSTALRNAKKTISTRNTCYQAVSEMK